MISRQGVENWVENYVHLMLLVICDLSMGYP
jgi:hypothetical protein